MNETHVEPVHVHVANAHELPGRGHACGHCGYKGNHLRKSVTSTYLVNNVANSADGMAQEILPDDPARCYAIVNCLDHNVILCHSKTQALGGTNTTDGTYATVAGYILQSSATAPTIVEGQTRLYAVAPQSSNCRVSVIAFVHQG